MLKYGALWLQEVWTFEFLEPVFKKVTSASAASDVKGAKIQNDISRLFYNIFLFQNIKIKLNSRTPMTLESSAVIFQALKPLQPH